MPKVKASNATEPGKRDVAPLRKTPSCEKSRSSPEIKARKVLMLERSRQLTTIRRMEGARVQMTIVSNVLKELLCDPAFVALLQTQGFATMPQLLRDRLAGDSR